MKKLRLDKAEYYSIFEGLLKKGGCYSCEGETKNGSCSLVVNKDKKFIVVLEGVQGLQYVNKIDKFIINFDFSENEINTPAVRLQLNSIFKVFWNITSGWIYDSQNCN